MTFVIRITGTTTHGDYIGRAQGKEYVVSGSRHHSPFGEGDVIEVTQLQQAGVHGVAFVNYLRVLERGIPLAEEDQHTIRDGDKPAEADSYRSETPASSVKPLTPTEIRTTFEGLEEVFARVVIVHDSQEIFVPEPVIVMARDLNRVQNFQESKAAKVISGEIIPDKSIKPQLLQSNDHQFWAGVYRFPAGWRDTRADFYRLQRADRVRAVGLRALLTVKPGTTDELIFSQQYFKDVVARAHYIKGF
jgi:hypothetical protein